MIHYKNHEYIGGPGGGASAPPPAGGGYDYEGGYESVQFMLNSC
jgi:hypothetical protein